MMARRKSLGRSAFRLVKRHPYPTAAVMLGLLAGVGIDRWLDVTDRTQLIVSAVTVALLLIGKFLMGVGYGAVYLIETLNPWTGYTSEVDGYVGKTRQYPPEKRIRQHLEGSSHYGTPAQPWEDTVVRWSLIHESRYVTNLGLHLREKVNILLRRPIYNYTMNLGNRRRVPKYTAIDQRAERDAWRLAA